MEDKLKVKLSGKTETVKHENSERLEPNYYLLEWRLTIGEYWHLYRLMILQKYVKWLLCAKNLKDLFGYEDGENLKFS